MKLLFNALILLAFCILALGSQAKETAYSQKDRSAMDQLVTRSIKPHGKLAEPEQYKLAVYLWEGGVRK